VKFGPAEREQDMVQLKDVVDFARASCLDVKKYFPGDMPWSPHAGDCFCLGVGFSLSLSHTHTHTEPCPFLCLIYSFCFFLFGGCGRFLNSSPRGSRRKCLLVCKVCLAYSHIQAVPQIRLLVPLPHSPLLNEKKLSLCLTKYHAMKTYWGSGGIAPRIFGLDTR
jgi:hypothetical protein